MRVDVVGAGAVGLTAAYDLAREGVDVAVWERETVGSGATGRAAGICYDAFATDVDAAVAERAMERFRAFDGEGGFDLASIPYVWLAREGDRESADAIREQVPRMRAHDHAVDLLESDESTERFPALRADDVAVAAVARDAVVTDPATYADLLADRARAAGATIHERAPVAVETDPVRVTTHDGAETVRDRAADHPDAVLVAAGAHTTRLLEGAGIPLACKPYRVQALTAGIDYRGPTCWDATDGCYWRPHPEGLLFGDGTEPREADPESWNPDGTPEFVRSALSSIVRSLDRSSGSVPVERAWAGLCTATPDRNPLLGELRDGLYVATGWHGHGFMRAPATGEAVTEEILGGDGIEQFDPARFDGDEEFPVVEGMTIE